MSSNKDSMPDMSGDFRREIANEAGKAWDTKLVQDEARVAIMSRARAMVAAGKPVLRIDDHGVTRMD